MRQQHQHQQHEQQHYMAAVNPSSSHLHHPQRAANGYEQQQHQPLSPTFGHAAAAAAGGPARPASTSSGSPRIRFAAEDRSSSAAESGHERAAAAAGTTGSGSSGLMGWLSWRGGRGGSSGGGGGKKRSPSPIKPGSSSSSSSPTPILVRRGDDHSPQDPTSSSPAAPPPQTMMMMPHPHDAAAAAAAARRGSLDSVGRAMALPMRFAPSQHQQQPSPPQRRQASPRAHNGGLGGPGLSIDVNAAQGLQEPVVSTSPSPLQRPHRRSSASGRSASSAGGSPSPSPSRSSRPRSRAGPSPVGSLASSPTFAAGGGGGGSGGFDQTTQQQQRRSHQTLDEFAQQQPGVTINGYRIAAAATAHDIVDTRATTTWTPTLGAMPFERRMRVAAAGAAGPNAEQPSTSHSWDNLAAWPMHRSASEPVPLGAAPPMVVALTAPHLVDEVGVDDAMADAPEDDEDDEAGGSGGAWDDASASNRASRRLSSRRMSGQPTWTLQDAASIAQQHRLSTGSIGSVTSGSGGPGIFPKRRSLSVDADANACSSFLPAFNIIPATPDGVTALSTGAAAVAAGGAIGPLAAESEVIETEYRAAPRILAQAFDSQPMVVDAQESTAQTVETAGSNSPCDLPAVRPLALSGKKSSAESLSRRAADGVSAATHVSSSSISSMTTASSSSSSSGHSSSASTTSLMSMMSTSSSLAIYAEIDEALDSLLGRVSPSASLEELEGAARSMRTPTPTPAKQRGSMTVDEERGLSRKLSGLGFGTLGVDIEDAEAAIAVDPIESAGDGSTSSPYALTTPRLQALEAAATTSTTRTPAAESPSSEMKTPRATPGPFTWPAPSSRTRDAGDAASMHSDATMMSDVDDDDDDMGGRDGCSSSSTRSSTALDADDPALDDLDSASIRLVASKTTLASPVRTEFGAGWGMMPLGYGAGNGWGQYASSEEGEIGIAL